MPQPLHVLVVEDSLPDANLILGELRNAGFEPVGKIVETEADYLQHLGTDFDIVLSDFTMPHFNAFRALELLIESGFDIPFILVTATIGEDVAVEAMKRGAADYLLKDRLTRLGPAVHHALEQRMLLRERNKERERLRLRETALAGVSQGVLICDANRLITYVNVSFTKITGYAESELLGRSCAILQGPDTDPGTILKIRTALNAGETFEGEILNYRKDGQSFWNELSIAPIPGGEGQPLSFIGIQRDVTERKLAELEIRFNEARFRSLVEATTAIVWDTPASGEFQSPQPGWMAFTGQSFEELRGWGWLDAIHPDDRVETERVWSTAFTNKIIYKVEHRLRRRDQVYRDMMVRAVPILAEDGAIRQWIGIHTDITVERLREKKLADALGLEKELSEKARSGDRAKSEFLAVMSHEIRTPLNGILGFSELLALTPNLPQQSRDYIQTITSSGEALLRILNDVLEISRLEAGNVQIEKVSFAPRDILGDVRTLLLQQAGEKKLAFGISVGKEIPKDLAGDVGRLRQILANLAGNAIKFTGHGSVILGMRATPIAGRYEFFVTDTGEGITPEQIEILFQPFTQADSSISRRHGGTGLGLSISRHLAELLGGTLIVRSQPGMGSEFILTVDLAAAEPVQDPAIGNPPQTFDKSFAGLHPLRILVVEDDKVNLKLMLALIRRLGYLPISAKNGLEAVEAQQREHPDCVLMDMQMPEMDGIEATAKIRALEKFSLAARPAFISAITANIFPADLQRCLDAGMNCYLNKPVKLAALAAILVEAGDFAAAHESCMIRT